MKYECHFNDDLNIIELVTHGHANLAGMKHMVQSGLDLCLQHVSADVLIDHSDLDVSPLSMNDISAVCNQIEEAVDIIKTRKCAHVTRDDLQYGLVRSWEIMIDLSGITDLNTMVFKNKTDAVQWIKSGC
jgi:hypothetical protein